MRIASFLLCALSRALVFSQAGALDQSFGVGGIANVDFNSTQDWSTGMVVQPDGRILQVGAIFEADLTNPHCGLVRRNADGSLDNTFGVGGKMSFDEGGSHEALKSVVIQPDGKIVAAGLSGSFMLLARFNSDGSLDSSFDSDGFAIATGGIEAEGNKVLLQPDGKILVVGQVVQDGWNEDVAVWRYNSDGSLDGSFGSNGLALTDLGGREFGNAIGLDEYGRILVAGMSAPSDGSHLLLLLRYDPDGSLETSFNDTGWWTMLAGDSGSDDVEALHSVAVQADGGIVAVGHSSIGSEHDIILIGLLPSGMSDPSFGDDGVSRIAIGDWARGYALQLQPDGKILVAGSCYDGDNGIVLARFLTDGSLDTSFDGDGIATTSIGSIYEGHSLALQADDRILVGGVSTPGSQWDFAVLRFLNDQDIGLLEQAVSNFPASVFPDPVVDKTVLNYELSCSRELTGELFDEQGRSVRKLFSNVRRSAGTHSETLDLSGVAAGQYVIVLNSQEEKVSLPLVKQ